jgi:hypothetical protein
MSGEFCISVFKAVEIAKNHLRYCNISFDPDAEVSVDMNGWVYFLHFHNGFFVYVDGTTGGVMDDVRF